MREETPTPFADERLSALLDGELDDAERRSVEEALARDAELRAELDALKRTRDFLRRRGPVEAPADFLDKVLAKVEQEPVPANSSLGAFLRRPFGLPLEAVAVAAAALLVVAGGVGGMGLFAGGAMVASKSDAPAVMAVPKEAPAPAATAEDAAPAEVATQQNLDVSQQGEADQKPRTIDIQGVKYGEEAFPGGVTTKDLGAGTGTRSVVAEGGASVRDFTSAPSTTSAPTGTSAPTPTTPAAASPVPALSSWRYVVTSDRGEILADLQGIAGKSGGRLMDRAGRAVSGGSTEGGTYLLVVPSDRIASVDTWLAKLGSERSGDVDATLYPSGWIAIQVDVVRFDQQDYRETSPAKPLSEKKTSVPGQ